LFRETGIIYKKKVLHEFNLTYVNLGRHPSLKKFKTKNCLSFQGNQGFFISVSPCKLSNSLKFLEVVFPPFFFQIVVLVYTADHILQAVSTVMSRRNRWDNLALLQTWFAILNSMLFHRTSQTLDCLPAFTAELRLLIQNVVTSSRQNENLEVCVTITQGIEK